MALDIPRGWPVGAASNMMEKRGTTGRGGGAGGLGKVRGSAEKIVMLHLMIAVHCNDLLKIQGGWAEKERGMRIVLSMGGAAS